MHHLICDMYVSCVHGSAGQESDDDEAHSSRVNQTAGDDAGSTPPAEALGNHCMENCRFQRSGTGDMIFVACAFVGYMSNV